MKIEGHKFSSLDNPHTARYAKGLKRKALESKKTGRGNVGTMTSHYSGKTYKFE